MSRPMVLGLVLLVLILTSQSDWKIEPKVDLEAASIAISKQQKLQSNHEKVNKEILVMQEKEIYVLKLHIKSLQEQLARCECGGNVEDNVEQAPQSEADTKQANNQRDDVMVESRSAVTPKLRGGTWSFSATEDHQKQPAKGSATLPLSGDSFGIAEEEEEKIEQK